MKLFNQIDHIAYIKLALELLDAEKTNSQSLESILDFGELIKKHSDDNNALIYDATEYIYEQQRLLNGEDGAYDDVDLRSRLDQIVRE